ncbi:MAG: hypothetical protein ACRDO7_09135 [Nocardioidaceae bacterium]
MPMHDRYVDIPKDPACAVTETTTSTSRTPGTWARAAESALRGSAASAKDPAVTVAFEHYLSELNPRMHSFGRERIDLDVTEEFPSADGIIPPPSGLVARSINWS